MNTAATLAALRALIGLHPAPPDRRTPEQQARDEWLESLAESRRDAHLSPADSDHAAAVDEDMRLRALGGWGR